MPFHKALADLCLRNARQALATGEPAGALDWLQRVPLPERSPDLQADIHYALASEALAETQWGSCSEHLREANRAVPHALYAERLRLVARRLPLQEERVWLSLAAKIDPAAKLSVAALKPDVAGVWACGAYYSRGSSSQAPWSRLLRTAKDPPEDPEERDAILALACGYLSRFILHETPLPKAIDAVVSIPANPGRFVKRMMSLPDELARSIEAQLAVPFLLDALLSNADDLELRGLSWSERRKAVIGSMSVGALRFAAGRNILLVDDVVTSGATLREASRLLRAAGAGAVYAITLSHTEG